MTKLRKKQVAEVRAAGAAAFREGKTRQNNPYPSGQSACDFMQWQRGHDDAAWEARCRVDASYERMNALRGCEGKENA